MWYAMHSSLSAPCDDNRRREELVSKEIREAAELAAQRVREDLWDDSLPVNPVIIAKRLGAQVFDANLPFDVSGIYRKDADGTEKIYLDTDDNLTRRRFSCAHEIGHMMDEDDQGPSVRIERRDSRASDGKSPAEIYANSFAAALLVPRSPLKRFLAVGMDSAALAKIFGVSSATISHRIDNLRRDGVIR